MLESGIGPYELEQRAEALGTQIALERGRRLGILGRLLLLDSSLGLFQREAQSRLLRSVLYPLQRLRIVLFEELAPP